LQAPDSGETDAVQRHAFAAQRQSHIAPALHPRRDQRVGCRIVLFEKIERLVGKHHAETEGGVGSILLEDADACCGHHGLEQNRRVQTRGAATDDFNPFKFDHGLLRPEACRAPAQMPR